MLHICPILYQSCTVAPHKVWKHVGTNSKMRDTLRCSEVTTGVFNNLRSSRREKRVEVFPPVLLCLQRRKPTTVVRGSQRCVKAPAEL